LPWVALGPALAAFGLAGLCWWRLARFESASLLAFYAFIASAGVIHTLLVATTIPPDDLRQLPVEKSYPTTQWRGLVIQEPVAQTSRLSSRAAARTNFVFRVESWRPTNGRYFTALVETPWQRASGRVDCTLIGPADDLQCGDRLEAAMALQPVATPLVPGSLDDRAYEAEQGIYYQAFIPSADWRRIENGSGNFWQNLPFRARDWAYARLQIGLEDDPRIADFLAGMLLGYRHEIPADIEQDFRRTGTLHVFAVSGQNVAELMVVALILLQLFGFVRWRWAWVLAPVVLVYCLLTGAPASAVRATVMILAILLAWRLGRPLHALACWSLAFLAMMLWNPAILLNPGAQLSSGVVLGLILLGPPLGRLLARPFAPDPFLPSRLLSTAQSWENVFWSRAGLLLGATLAATLVSEPITAIDFHQVTSISVLANLIVVPMAGLITVVGTLAVTFSLFTTIWAAWLNNANWLFAKLLIGFVGFLAHEPGASINVPDVRALEFPQPEFVIAPVRDSACLLVRTSRAAWLVNCGRESAARATTSHLLQFYGINRLDGLVLAQLGVADNGGAEIIVRDFKPRRLILPALGTRSPLEKTLPALFALFGHAPESWSRGEQFQLAPGLRVEVLNPDPDTPPGRAEDRALVLLFHAGTGSLLWAGRIDADLRYKLIADHPGLRADVLALDPQSQPDADWLAMLQVRHWLQFPLRDRRLNLVSDPNTSAQAWPLEQTGAVELHFNPEAILLRPWIKSPAP
jgi:competence protein ComEC